MKQRGLTITIFLCVSIFIAGNVSFAADGKLRIICFGAHPDDCELKAGGAAALWAKEGHAVKFVSVTNGDVGHWRDAGGSLAKRRTKEVEAAAAILGIETEVLDIHDGELMPTLENRRTITRLIREWNADIVISHRSNDYHPDHRYSAILVQDAAFMVVVPFFCPDTPPLKRNPVFMYYSDRFQKPAPFTADIVVDIDPVIETKLDALSVIDSQFVEGGVSGNEKRVPNNDTELTAARQKVKDGFHRRFKNIANQHRVKLIELYGESKGKSIQHAEAYELCEYGRRPRIEELKKMFPGFE